MKTLYAIRHIPTGFFLPEPMGRMGRGGSRVEPVDCSGDGPNPRLFVTMKGATNALTQWLRGTHHRETCIEGNWDDVQYEVECSPSIRHQPHRKKEEMEVVPINLQIN